MTAEDELMRGYANTPAKTDRGRCACRGWIVPESSHPVDIEEAVVEHQSSDDHQEWRGRGGMEPFAVRRVA